MRLWATILVLFGWAGPVARAADYIEPYQMARSLEQLQEQMARGSVAAQAAQAPMLVQMAEQFRRVPAPVWRDRRNADAMMIFLLAGGRADAIAQAVIAQREGSSSVDALKAALALAQGRTGVAVQIFGKIDPLSIGGSSGAQLALAHGTLALQSDSKRANQLFDVARLLLPGSLVEETALRRQCYMAGVNGDTDRFAFLARQYWSRFAQSVHASKFQDSVSAALVALALAQGEAALENVEPLLALFEPALRSRLWLDVSAAALTTGRLELAANAAARIIAAKLDDPTLLMRARIHAAIVGLFSDDYGAAENFLANADLQLIPDEIPLVQAARDLSVQMRAPLAKNGSVDGGKAQTVTPLMQIAERSLSSAATMLDDGKK